MIFYKGKSTGTISDLDFTQLTHADKDVAEIFHAHKTEFVAVINTPLTNENIRVR